jgi:hypothetical protein
LQHNPRQTGNHLNVPSISADDRPIPDIPPVPETLTALPVGQIRSVVWRINGRDIREASGLHLARILKGAKPPTFQSNSPPNSN